MHYLDTKQFDKGIHCEGSLMSSLFFIFFWDIIFNDSVACSFVGPIQTVPLDFFGTHFFENRKEAIVGRLEDIKMNWSDDQLQLYVMDTWNLVTRHVDRNFVHDDYFVLKIVSVLTRGVLGGILDRLAKNYDECRAGMPDLFLWNDNKVCWFRTVITITILIFL